MRQINHSPPPVLIPSLAALALLATLAACGGSRAVEDTHPGLLPPASLDEAPRALGGERPDRVVKRSELEGKATWYGPRYHGRKTANGETFDMEAFTAAHRTLPFNTVVRVVDRKTRKSVLVRINDRGPFGRRSRIIDLARAAADEIGILERGVTPVELEIVTWGDGARYHHGRKTVPKKARQQQKKKKKRAKTKKRRSRRHRNTR